MGEEREGKEKKWEGKEGRAREGALIKMKARNQSCKYATGCNWRCYPAPGEHSELTELLG